MNDGVDTATALKAKLYGTRGSPEAYAIRDFLHRCDISFEWVELTSDAQARSEAGTSGLHDPRLPICQFSDGTRLEHPTVRQIAEKLGWLRTPSRTEYDLAIYGGGPAGLSAAVYGASEGLRTVLVERFALGGQASTSPRIENYLGFPRGISGGELAERAREQAERFGTEILLLRAGVRGEFTPGRGVGHLDDGTWLVARASVCATGVNYRRLGLPDEDRFIGAGVYYGAGASEAELCGQAGVFVVGGGNSAVQAALHLAKYASSVTIVIRGASLKESSSEYLIDRVCRTPNVKVMPCSEVVALDGGELLHTITLRDNQTGKEWVEETNWLFLCLGGVPHTDWASEVGIVRDAGGYLVTGPDLMADRDRPPGWTLNRQPYYLETNIPGVFAAGDVRHGAIKRVASAVGEGAMAIALVHRYLNGG